MDVKICIIEVAQEIIQKEGFDAFSFRDLAKKVGVKSSSVHYHFPKKEDLIQELTKKYFLDFEQTLTEISSRNLTGKEKISPLGDVFLTSSKSEKFCFCGMMSAFSSRVDEESLTLAELFFKMIEDWIYNILNNDIKIMNNKSELKPRDLARSLISILEGGLLMDHLRGTKSFLRSSLKLINYML